MPAVLFLVENASVPTDPRVWPECTTLRDAGWDVVAVSPRGAVTDTAPHEVVDGVDIHRFAPSESGGGIRGIGFSMINYLDELPYFCTEVLPRLVRLGARSQVSASRFS